MIIVNVNCEIVKECGDKEKYDVRGYPSYILFKNGKRISDYKPTYPR